MNVKKKGIPCTLITDGMAGSFAKSGQIQSAVAGCDRVAANGDTANKLVHMVLQYCVSITMSHFILRCQQQHWIEILYKAKILS